MRAPAIVTDAALTREQVQAMAAAAGLTIPETDIANVVLRLSALLAAMDDVELELGEEMDRVDPVPPVFTGEDF